MPTNIRDPRSIITPEAFEIDEALLGTPLARPARRLAALVIDIVIIGVLTAVTSGIALFIWGFVAVFLLVVAIRGPGRSMGQFTTVLFRGSTGCLGVLVLLIVLGAGLATMLSRDEDARAAVESRVQEFLMRTAVATPQAANLQGADTRAEAEVAARELLAILAEAPMVGDMDEDEVADLMTALLGDTTAFTSDPDEFAAEMVGRFWPRGGEPEEAPAAPSTATGEVVDFDVSEVLARYRQGLEDGRTASADPLMAALQDRLVQELAADTLTRLEAALTDERARRQRSEETMVEAQAQLEAQGSGFVALLRDIWDQAGSAVGLWSIYFTVTLTLFRGFTVGKRAMGIRVLRLDGEPITWWSAFERAGGYVAGIATGLLGFAQVYWDPNRQCVHDKIIGTVVVVAGADPVPGAWESAWSDASSPRPSVVDGRTGVDGPSRAAGR
jgi:hypothetical protein